jgi:GGDEF domain-containing protein
MPVRTASGEDLHVLLRALEGVMRAMIPAAQEIVKLSGEENAVLLERLKEAREAMARFAPTGKDQ